MLSLRYFRETTEALREAAVMRDVISRRMDPRYGLGEPDCRALAGENA